MNHRSFVCDPWIEPDGDGYVVVVTAYHWCGHPRWGFSVHRFFYPTFAEAEVHLLRLGFRIPEGARA